MKRGEMALRFDDDIDASPAARYSRMNAMRDHEDAVRRRWGIEDARELDALYATARTYVNPPGRR